MYGLQHISQQGLHILGRDIVVSPSLDLIRQITNKAGLLREHKLTDFLSTFFSSLMIVMITLTIRSSHPLIHNTCS
tara:strand:- start:139038 stop:139265 length:228 start_codon:yes stop_codon:yes gene_type:complete